MINRELINPQSIVVVGGSNNVHKPGGRLVRNLLDGKVDGVLIATLFADSVIRLSQELDNNEIPYVYVDSNIKGQHQLAYFGTESYDAGVIAARLLTDRLSSSSDILMARIIHSGKNDSIQG